MNKCFVCALVLIYSFKFSLCVEEKYGVKNTYAIIPCINDADCKEVNGTCVDDNCHCEGREICEAIETPSLVTQLNQMCKGPHSCNIENAICGSNSTCICKDGYVAKSDKRQCLEVSSGIGQTCEENIQCTTKIPSSVCQENKCECLQHMHDYDGSCYKTVALEHQCQLNGECSMTPKSACRFDQCKCNDGFVSSGDQLRCLPIVEELNSPCDENSQCEASFGYGSECSNSKCSCRALFQFSHTNKKCMEDLLLNEECSLQMDCNKTENGDQSKLECYQGFCKCKKEFFEKDGNCLKNTSTSLFSFQFVSICLILNQIARLMF